MAFPLPIPFKLAYDAHLFGAFSTFPWKRL